MQDDAAAVGYVSCILFLWNCSVGPGFCGWIQQLCTTYTLYVVVSMEQLILKLLASHQTSENPVLHLCVIAREAPNRRWCEGK